jgi:Bacterial Ig domain
MSLMTPRACLRAIVLGVLVLGGGVAAYALDAGATRASGRSSRSLSIRWLSPRDGGTVRGTLRGPTCDVAVHDTSRVTKVAFTLDGSLLTTDAAPPYTCEISAAGLSPGIHIFTAKAYDTAGNALSTHISVSTLPTTRPRISVTVQGDSLTVGSWWRIPAHLGPNYYFVSYSAHWGRPSGKGLSLLRKERLGRVVVFALGTNDWWSTPSRYRQHLTSVLQMIGPRRCLVVPTIWHEGPNRALNAVLHSLATRYGLARMRLARWSEAVASRRVRLSPDGTHPDTEAAWNSRAAIVASAIRACAASVPAERGSPSVRR